MTDSNTSRRLPAASGWYWFRDAATAVGRKPLNLLAVTMLYLLIMGFLSAIPYAGIVFAALFMPFGTAFIGRSTRTALQGGDPRLSELKAVFADPVVRQNLMRIGFVYGFILITVNALYGLMAADSIALWKIDANDRLDWASRPCGKMKTLQTASLAKLSDLLKTTKMNRFSCMSEPTTRTFPVGRIPVLSARAAWALVATLCCNSTGP